jgi:glycosyltransferase involved in cell wall biosynthesis
MIKKMSKESKIGLARLEWSVVIPTLWIPRTFPQLLEDLSSANHVLEVIVICNAPKPAELQFSSEKIRFIECEENIFVNPAWNRGVFESKSRFVAICNDDVLFNPDLFGRVGFEAINESVIGCDQVCFTNAGDAFEVMNGHSIGDGWGCLIFADKQSFRPIPEDLKIWYGDNWLALKFPMCKSLVWQVNTAMGESTSKPDLRAIAKMDRDVWFSKTNFFERIQLEALRASNGGAKSALSVGRYLFVKWLKQIYYLIYVKNFKKI